MDLDRRQFLKLGLAASASVAASGAFGALGHALSGRHVARTTSNFHAWVDTACRMCPAGCGIRAFHDKYGNLVTLAGIPEHPVNQGKICAKGMAAINLHYHPERLLTPLVAKKGRGKGMEGIGYNEALKKAADMVRQAKAANALFVVDTQDEDPEVYDTLFRMLGVDFRILSRPILERRHRERIDYEVYGHPHVHPDFRRATTILVIGANPFEGGDLYLPLVREITEARMNRNARLIVIDPRNTNTAGKADRWLPIRPGTDLLACMRLNQLLHLDWEPNPAPPAGMTFDDLYRITGIGKEAFEDLARILKDDRGGLAVIAGNGIYGQPSAVRIRKYIRRMEERCGGWNRKFRIEDSDVDCIAAYSGSAKENYEEWFAGDRPVFLITRRSNPIYEGQGETLYKAMGTAGKLIGHLSISPFGNETNRHADLLFPERIPLEDWGLVPLRWWDGSWSERKADQTLQRPIPNPPKGVSSGYDVMMDISETIGMKGVAQVLGRTKEERIGQKLLSMTPMVEGNKTSILYRSNGYPLPVIFKDRSEFIDQNTNAVSEEFEPEIQEGAVPPVDVPDPDSMQLIVHDTNVMNDELANAKWLAEVSHQNTLVINPADAKKLQIRQGDEVRIETHGKRMVVSADLREGIRPGVVSLARGFGHAHYGKVARGENWRTDDPDMWLIWWGQYGNGVNAHLLTSGRPVTVKLVKV